MTKDRHGWLATVFLLFANLTVAGCTLLSPVQDAPTKGVLNQMPSTLPQREIHQESLLVLPPEASPPFDTSRMAYTNRPYQLGYFNSHEWAATPSQMLQPLLVRTLERTGRFRAVVTPAYSAGYTYALRTTITNIIQDFTTEPAEARLSLRVQLSDGASGRIVAAKEIDVREPMQDKNPAAGVVAANQAAARALEELALFVLDNVKAGTR